MIKSEMRKLLKYVFWTVMAFVIIFIGLMGYVVNVSRIEVPDIKNNELLSLKRVQKDSTYYTIRNNWFRKSETGLYEIYVEGDAFERGVILGKLTEGLVQKQEFVFHEQIKQLVPSSFYRKFLTYFIGWFNRNLDEHVSEEFKQEILGVSQSASHDYDHIAPAYQRILNYHAAHDIGHALQNMSLVGCTSFAAWNTASQDSTLIIGRNFDFFVGTDFAQDKIVAFYRPLTGHKFVTITWGGMTGVISGMNDQGLTVTLNAAKSEMPAGAATPVSLVAREILQYASTINEAFEIARSRNTFVAESFLVGSAKDKRAAIIEKTPDEIALFESDNDWIIDTNHFQSELLRNTKLNQKHIQTSASPYRYDRVKELLLEEKLTIGKTVSILRNRNGLHDRLIGMGNEKAINQLVAHHAIVFQPEKGLVWISTAPWQLGKFVAYDLNKVFSMTNAGNDEIYEEGLTVPADSFRLTLEYKNYLKYFQYRFPFQPHGDVIPDSIVKWNPELYHSFMLAGDEACKQKDFKRALNFFARALEKVIATEQERTYIIERMEYCKSKME